MNKRVKDLIKLVVFLSLGLFFVWFSLKDLTAEQRMQMLGYAQNVLHGYNWIFLLLCAFIGFLSVWFRGLRSVIMLEPIGYQVSRANAYHSVMICYLANLAIPRLGELLRCTVLQRYENVPFQKSLGTVITERVLDLLICSILFLGALALEYDNLMTILTANKAWENIVAIFSNTGKYIVLGVLLLIVLVVFLFRKKIAQIPGVVKIKSILLGFWQGLISIKDLKRPVAFVVYSLSIWFCYYLMFYVCTFAFPDLRALGYEAIFASMSCVVIGTLGFIVAQGGLGAYPLLISAVLVLYGINTEVGLAVGWVIWTTETLMYLILGLLSVGLIALQKQKKKQNGL